MICVIELYIQECGYHFVFLGHTVPTEPGYLGCFRDPYSYLSGEPEILRNRALSDGPHTYSNENTPDLCVNYCKDKGFYYAGVEHSDECFCGNQAENYSRHGILPDSECYFRCDGDDRETCGGADKIAIYQTQSEWVTVVNYTVKKMGNFMLGIYLLGNIRSKFEQNYGISRTQRGSPVVGKIVGQFDTCF